MRRKEKEVRRPEAIELILREAKWGALSLVTPEGRPFIVPLSFVYYQNRLFFHSAPAGEKMAMMKASPEACFLVVDTFSKIPSYLFHPNDGGAGITLLRSVILHGRISMVRDLDRKASVLQALMSKYQPEGGYEPITATSLTYKARVQGLAIFEMAIERRSGKFSVGQTLKAEEKNLYWNFLKGGGQKLTNTLWTLWLSEWGLMRAKKA